MNKHLKIFVINLERSKDRRAFIEKQLDQLNLKYELVKAIDGANLTDEELKLYSKKEAIRIIGRELSNGEIGCALTHAKIWQRMINDNIEEALILEDDALIGEMLIKILEVREKFPDNWEHINFSANGKHEPFGKPIYDIYRMAKIKRGANRTSTYLLNLSGAKKLIEHVYPIRLASDGIMGRIYITNLTRYGIFPQVASYGLFDSVVWDNKKMPKTNLIFKFKRAFKRILKLFKK